MPRKLCIGGTTREVGWEHFEPTAKSIANGFHNVCDLSMFADATFAAIYASHILEHFDYQGDLEAVLNEWHRVLEPGGKLFLSVPDLDVLARMFLNKSAFSAEERFFIMRMMYGGHVNFFAGAIQTNYPRGVAHAVKRLRHPQPRCLPGFGWPPRYETQMAPEIWMQPWHSPSHGTAPAMVRPRGTAPVCLRRRGTCVRQKWAKGHAIGLAEVAVWASNLQFWRSHIQASRRIS